MRKVDLALFLLGETALTRREVTELARDLGYRRDVDEKNAGELVRVQPAEPRA